MIIILMTVFLKTMGILQMLRVPFFAIGLALLLKKKRPVIHFMSRTIVVLCIMLCQFQTYQYRYYIIHWENMNSEKYWEVFLQLDMK